MLVDSTQNEKVFLCMNQLIKEYLVGISFIEKAAILVLNDFVEKHPQISPLTGADHKEVHFESRQIAVLSGKCSSRFRSCRCSAVNPSFKSKFR